MLITFIRHSKTKLAPNTPIELWGLSEEGITRAQELCSKVEVKDINVLYSSLQTKALETAAIISKNCEIPIKTNNGLNEISSFTIKFFGSPTYEENVDNYYSDKLPRIAGGETHKEALQRFEETLAKIVKKEDKAQNIGVISHGNILSYFTAKYSSYTPRELHDSIKMPDLAVFDYSTKKFTKLWRGISND